MKVSKFEMSHNTKKKALLLCEEITSCIKNNCYFTTTKPILKLTKMIERHIKKELKE